MTDIIDKIARCSGLKEMEKSLKNELLLLNVEIKGKGVCGE